MKTNTATLEPHPLVGEHRIVSRAEWLAARKELLKKEKESTRLRDQLSAERRDMPWVKVSKNYLFDSPNGKVSLAQLFAGRSQLVIYHFMFGPDWQEGCPSCSFVSDHLEATLPHVAARDVTLAVVSRAPLAKLEAFKKRMGWHFNWVSSYGGDFNADFHVSFTPEEIAQGKVNYNYTMQEFPSAEAPGLSVFYKDAAGDIYHTYSTYGRGLEPLLATYQILDLVPKGRDEALLDFPMAWIRYHDRYGTNEFADADKPYWPETSAAAAPTAASACGCGSASAARRP
ncbi:MAG TPA: thioredoxin family protein [Candidatus Limnocylindria bacterium]|nr:thioredoxin family protein [Candidatus Limnocylindria bacterium]